MTHEILFALIGAAVGIISVTVAVVVARRSSHHDQRNRGERDGVLLSDIGYVKSGIDDIKTHQREQDKRHLDMVGRVAAVEQSAKQAHHRIDRIEGKGNDG